MNLGVLLRAALRLTGAALLLAVPALADTTVVGTFQYQDREFGTGGFTGTVTARPIRFADVRIVTGSTTLATGATDASGSFSIVVPGSTAQSISALAVTSSTATPGLLLDLRVPITVGIDFYSFGDFYSVASEAKNSPGSGTVDLGTTLALASTDAGKVFNIWDVVNDCFDWAASSEAALARPATRLTVLWRATHSGTFSFFSPGSTKFLFMRAASAYDDTIIGHETGHFLDNIFSKSDNPGGDHFLFDDSQDMRLSWAEGLATALGSAVRRFKAYPRPDIYVDTDGLGFSYDIERLQAIGTPVASKIGSSNEVAVSAVLWDIVDGPSTADATPGTDDDPLERPFADVWEVLTKYLKTLTASTTVERMWDGWFAPSIDNGALSEMQTIFSTLGGMEFVSDAFEGDNTAATAPITTVAQVPALAAGAKVLLSELDLGSVDAVELYNAGSAEADLNEWTLTAFASGVPVDFVLPSFRLAPGAFVILSEASGANTNTTLFLDNNIPWSNGSSGACSLVDAGGTGRDFVRWGGSTQTPPSGTTFTGSNPASPGSDKNLARGFAGMDTDAGSDWTAQRATLGTYNLGGDERHHTFYGAGDSDYAWFDTVSGRSYLVETVHLTNGADTVLDLLAADGTTVLANNDDFNSTRASRVTWTATAGGKLFARVRRFDGKGNFAQYGSYDLRIIESTKGLTAPTLLTVSKPGQGGSYGTLSDAVARANNGDTIEILDNGTYNESLTIDGKNLTLRAAPGKNPILDGSSSVADAVLILSNNTSAKIEGLTIAGGYAGIAVTSGAATIVNSVIRGANLSQLSDGIDVVGSNTSARIVNCTILDNRQAGVGLFSRSTAAVVNSIVRGNSVADVGSDGSGVKLTVRNSLIGDGGFAGTGGNISGDPLFVDASLSDYRLEKGSPAIDRGDAADPDLPPTDADGLPRALDGDGNGSALPDMGAYEYVAPESLTFTTVFPQVAVGGPYQTSIVGINTGSATANVSMALRDKDGTPLQITVANQGEIPNEILLAKQGSSFRLAIPPSGTVRVEASGGTNQVSGYAKLSSSLPIDGTALFKTISGDRVTSEAGVGLSKPTRSFTVYIDNLNNANSGYAVANFGTDAANLTLTLRDASGATRQTTTLVLGAGEHVAQFAFERFTAATAGFEGSIEFTSDRDVAAVALRFDNVAQDVFSTIPVLSSEAETTLYFPQVADGVQDPFTRYRTNFILVNPSATQATVKLEFFASEGTPRALPIGGVLKPSHEVTLGPRGVARFVTDGTLAVVSNGWVRVTSTVAIGGSAIFQTVSGGRITSEAGVASSPSSARLTTYVESLGFTESGLAIANPNSVGVTVTLRLRSGAGAVAATTDITLPAMGHTAKFFTQWFSGFDSFEGTLEVSSTLPVSAVALRYDNEGADVFATLPVVVIP